MPYKDPVKARKYRMKWRKRNRNKIRKYDRKWYKLNRAVTKIKK